MSGVAAVVVAAGRSVRFGPGAPKQFLDLDGEPLVLRALRAVARRPGVDGAVVVLPGEALSGEVASRLRAEPGVLSVVAGGETRARSVAAGLEAARDAAFVLVHDAARPFVPGEVVDRVLDAAREHGASVPVVPVSDTVKRDDGSGRVAETIDRTPLRLAQTPQGARTDWLRDALAAAFRDGLEPTDEAQALERAGRPVVLVAGDPRNVKVTTPEDLARARAAGGPREEIGLRVGTGFDIHRFGGDRPLVLGGVPFPGEAGLLGHSDADVLLHAAMDAVLGAAGLPDIGALFPPDDPAFAGADSRALAAEVASRARAAGFALVNLDVTLLAERPRIRERVEAMRGAVAAAFGIPPDRVGIKATTLEGIGGLGRGEGIACQAVALATKRPGPVR